MVVNILEMLGAAFILVLGFKSLLWVVYYFQKNAGIVDIGWAFSFILVSWVYFFLGEGATSKLMVMTAMVTIWAGRLTWYLFQRYLSMSEEDPRYQEIRKNWGSENSDFKFYMMFIFQGVLVVILSLPFLIVSADATRVWYPVEFLGILVWFGGVVGEAFADKQLLEFKCNPENQGKVCKEGLWKYSRHPNYFFEFVIWLGFFLFALGSPGGWVSIISLGLILLLLFKVSGIPQAEAQALKTRGALYEEYQMETSSFFPWFPRKRKPIPQIEENVK